MANFANHPRHLLENLAVERVQRRRPIHSERGDRCFLKNNIFEFHEVLLRCDLKSLSTIPAFLVPPCALSVSTPPAAERGRSKRREDRSTLARTARAGNNAHVPGRFRSHRGGGAGAIAASVMVAILACIAAGCGNPAKAVGDKIRADADTKCQQGNQPACPTVVQALNDTKGAIETTSTLETQTPAWIAGRQDACQQAAALQAEISAWCSMYTAQARPVENAARWTLKSDALA